MKNKTGMMPANGHRIQGRSSEEFLDCKIILDELNLKGDENFIDAGCGDGHVAIEALNYIKTGNVYAIDIYEPSIDDLIKYKEENNIENLIPLVSNLASEIKLEDNLIDVILMVNVFHGFKAMRLLDEAVEEMKRILKPGGKIAIMDYKKQDVKHGPPTAVRSSPEDLEELFNNHDMKLAYLNNEIGEDIPEGKSHFLIVFEK